MEILIAPPPNFAEIAAVFPNAHNPGVIFTFGGAIYNPSGARITPALVAHESMHSKRQGDDPAGWWKRYLAEPEFRLDEEMRAHVAEYGAVCAEFRDRNKRARMLHHIAQRVSGPLYGRMIRFIDARDIIAGAAA